MPYTSTFYSNSASVIPTSTKHLWWRTDEKLLYQHDGTAWIVYLTGGALIIPHTYAELEVLVAANGLVPGQKYLLTDYVTKYNFPFTGNLYSADVLTVDTGGNGATYPDHRAESPLYDLILTAITDSAFEAVAKSPQYPSIDFHYDFGDNLTFGSNVVGNVLAPAQRNGLVYGVYDNAKNARFDFDVIQSCAEIFKPLVSATPYAAGYTDVSTAGVRAIANLAGVQVSYKDFITITGEVPQAIYKVAITGVCVSNADAKAKQLVKLPYGVNDYASFGDPFGIMVDLSSTKLRKPTSGATNTSLPDHTSDFLPSNYFETQRDGLPNYNGCEFFVGAKGLAYKGVPGIVCVSRKNGAAMASVVNGFAFIGDEFIGGGVSSRATATIGNNCFYSNIHEGTFSAILGHSCGYSKVKGNDVVLGEGSGFFNSSAITSDFILQEGSMNVDTNGAGNAGIGVPVRNKTIHISGSMQVKSTANDALLDNEIAGRIFNDAANKVRLEYFNSTSGALQYVDLN